MTELLTPVAAGALRLLALLPPALLRALGRALGLVAWAILPGRRRIAERNLALALGDALTPAERRRIARRVFENLGLNLVEALHLERELRALEVEGREHLDAALREGRGVVLIGAHFGSWELTYLAFGHLGYDISIVTRRLPVGLFQRLWDRSRARRGVHVLPPRGSARALHEALERGGIMGLVIDQHAAGNKGRPVPFFSHLAATTDAPARLAERTGAPVLAAFCLRLEGGRKRLHITPPIPFERPAGHRREDALHNTARYNALLEAWIRRHPEQWHWVHRRWKLLDRGSRP